MSLRLFSSMNRLVPEVERKIVKFAVGNILCAVDIMHVREIIQPRATSPLASEDESVIGVLDHRDTAIPVIDLRKRFNTEEPSNVRQKWLIIAMERVSVALVVDMVFGVCTLNQNQKRNHSSLASMGATNLSWAAEVYGDPDGLLFEIDLDILAGSVTAK